MTGPQQFEEVPPAFGQGGGEPGEAVVADLGADPVASPVAGAGVVDTDPGRALEAGAQDRPRLAGEARLTRVQQAHHLALGDHHPESAQQGDQTRHRGLAPVVEGQHETAQLGPEVARDPRRQRRDKRRPRRHHPALPVVAHSVRAHQQILDHIGLGALEARTRRGFDREPPLFVDQEPRSLLAAARLLAPVLGLAPRGRRLVHAAGFDLGPSLEPLEARDLLAQARNLGLQRRDLLQSPENQPLEVGQAQGLNIWRRRGHRPSDSYFESLGNPPPQIFSPGVLPLLPSSRFKLTSPGG